MSSDHIEESNAKVTLDESGENATLETNNSGFANNVTHGVNDDNLDYKKLIFWSVLGVSIVAVFIVSLIYFSEFSLNNAKENAGSTTSYLEVTKLKADQTATLNSYGVVDLEKRYLPHSH